MFDDLTFALRYESEVHVSVGLLLWSVPVPVTQNVVDEMKRTGWWPFLEERFGPYVLTES
jgi:hypothetical protein